MGDLFSLKARDKNVGVNCNFIKTINFIKKKELKTMLSKEETRLIENILNDLFACPEAAVFKQPVDYKGE